MVYLRTTVVCGSEVVLPQSSRGRWAVKVGSSFLLFFWLSSRKSTQNQVKINFENVFFFRKKCLKWDLKLFWRSVRISPTNKVTNKEKWTGFFSQEVGDQFFWEKTLESLAYGSYTRVGGTLRLPRVSLNRWVLPSIKLFKPHEHDVYFCRLYWLSDKEKK